MSHKINHFPSYLQCYFPLINQELIIYVNKIDYQQLVTQIKSYQLLNKISNTLDIKIHQVTNDEYIIEKYLIEHIINVS